MSLSSFAYPIKSPLLRPHIQYILFNKLNTSESSEVVCFPNTNICLGLIKNHRLKLKDGNYYGEASKGISTYTTGLYSKAHRFYPVGSWDEICIDFNPLSFFHFFNLPSKPKIFEQDLKDELFSKKEIHQLELIFEVENLKFRAHLIEQFLLKKLKPFDEPLLQLALYECHKNNGRINIKQLIRNTRSTEKKLYQTFKHHFGIRPKQYLRVLKIRRALNILTQQPEIKLGELAYIGGYYDQSHFIKECVSLCGSLPKLLKKEIHSVNDLVLVKSC